MQTRIRLAGALAALLLSSAAAGAQQLELNFGTVNDPGGMQYLSAEEWAKQVNAALGDQAKVEVYGSSQLGSDKEMLQKLKLGTLDMALPSTVMSSEVDLAGIFEMPFWRFQIANFSSAFVWAAVLLTLGDVVAKGIRLMWGG